MRDPSIERGEVVALLFNVSDISVMLTNIERLLGEDDGEEETDEDRARRARRETSTGSRQRAA
jgi:hypothetical protein